MSIVCSIPGIGQFKCVLIVQLNSSLILQIALAAVLHAASKEQENLDHYVTESLFFAAKDKLPILIEAVRSESKVNSTFPGG